MAERNLRRLAGGARPGIFLGALAVALVGLFLPGWPGAVLLAAMVGALGWLLAQTWPVTSPGLRAFRVLILAGFVVFAAYKIMH